MSTDTDSDVIGQIEQRTAGFLNKTVYVGLSRLTDRERWPPPPDVILEHIDYMHDLEAEGVLFAAGPFIADDGSRLTDGMLVVRADDRGAAEQILARDPFHEHGFRTVTVERWELNQGMLGVRVSLSEQRYELL